MKGGEACDDDNERPLQPYRARPNHPYLDSPFCTKTEPRRGFNYSEPPFEPPFALRVLPVKIVLIVFGGDDRSSETYPKRSGDKRKW
jgi:hypothetical protein